MTQMVERDLDNWERNGSCVADPELWSTPDRNSQLLAKHICLHHCPVLVECMRQNLGVAHCGVVIAGRIWKDKYPPGQLSALNDARINLVMRCRECGSS